MWSGVEHPSDLAAFTRLGDGRCRDPSPVGGAPVRLLGRLAEAGVRSTVEQPGAAARVDAGAGRSRRRLP